MADRDGPLRCPRCGAATRFLVNGLCPTCGHTSWLDQLLDEIGADMNSHIGADDAQIGQRSDAHHADHDTPPAATATGQPAALPDSAIPTAASASNPPPNTSSIDTSDQATSSSERSTGPRLFDELINRIGTRRWFG